jgi:tRNA pseudouridine55 synthase
VSPDDPALDRSGLVVVDKPGGMTSHDVVARIRRIAGTRKVGHAGTLDPMATGVLLVGVNRATRLLGHLALTEKAYDATVRLGEATTTDDAEGEVVRRTAAGHLTEHEVRRAVEGFLGDIEQRPSAVSAVKVRGRRAYDRVRAGEEVELPARRVTVHELRVDEVRRDGEGLAVEIGVRCSSGTYVRALARDLGEILGVGGHLTALRRTAVGPFDLDRARSLDALTERFELLDLSDVAREAFSTYRLDAEQAARVRHGRPLEVVLGTPTPVALLDPEDRFLALYEQRGRTAVPVAVFV